MFSGGSFIYVPPGVKVKHPLQAYFRINAENFGQFERTLIIADEGAEVMYMEGCTAPKFETATLHSAVVELVAMKGAKIQYVTVQNWSSNVFNLVTKRGIAHEEAEVKWIDCNIGSRLTMKYPGVIMKGRKARGEVISHRARQHRPAPGHRREDDPRRRRNDVRTSSASPSASARAAPPIAAWSTFRSTSRAARTTPSATRCSSTPAAAPTPIPPSPCAATSTPPSTRPASARSAPSRSSTCSSAASPKAEAMSLSVNGFINDLVREFPMEYSVELKRLIDLEMEGIVG